MKRALTALVLGLVVLAGLVGPASGTADAATAEGAAATPRLRAALATPKAPRVKASGLSGQLKVSWKVPRGVEPSSVEVQVVRGRTKVVGGGKRKVVLTGLTDGQDVRVRVRFFEGRAAGPWSKKSAPAHPYGVPGAPAGVVATSPADGVVGRLVALRWEAADAHGSPVVSQVVRLFAGGALVATHTVPGSVRADSFAVDNGRDYRATVTALNAAGAGSESTPSNIVTPYGAPNPASGTASAGYRSVVFAFAPGAPNGRTVRGVEYRVGGGAWQAGTGTTVTVRQGGDQACVEVRTVADGSAGGTAYSDVRTVCGTALPRSVIVRLDPVGPTGGCSANCRRIQISVDGFAAGPYTIFVSQPGTPGEFPPRQISVGADGRGSYNNQYYTGFPASVSVTIDGVTGSATP